jgi:hypothetical protein
MHLAQLEGRHQGEDAAEDERDAEEDRERGEALVRPRACHRVLRHWLAELGHDAYRDDAPVTAAGGGGSPPASR